MSPGLRLTSGDGSAATAFSTSSSTTHRYDAPGLYTVTARVRDTTGQETVYRFTQAVAGTTTAGGAAPNATSALAWEPATSTQGARLWVVPNPSGLNAHDTIASLAAAYAEPARAAGVLPEG